MVVAKKDFQTEFVMLELTVYNMALKSTTYNHTVSQYAISNFFSSKNSQNIDVFMFVCFVFCRSQTYHHLMEWINVSHLSLYSTIQNQVLYVPYYRNLMLFSNLQSDSGPMNLHVAEVYDKSVRLKWTVAPSCYQRTYIILNYCSSDGQTVTRNMSIKDQDWIDLASLDPETTYNLTFVTYYGNERSDPVPLLFTTQESPSALTGGAIAGISVGM